MHNPNSFSRHSAIASCSQQQQQKSSNSSIRSSSSSISGGSTEVNDKLAQRVLIKALVLTQLHSRVWSILPFFSEILKSAFQLQFAFAILNNLIFLLEFPICFSSTELVSRFKVKDPLELARINRDNLYRKSEKILLSTHTLFRVRTAFDFVLLCFS